MTTVQGTRWISATAKYRLMMVCLCGACSLLFVVGSFPMLAIIVWGGGFYHALRDGTRPDR